MSKILNHVNHSVFILNWLPQYRRIKKWDDQMVNTIFRKPIHSSRDTVNSRYWERRYNPSSPATYFHISYVKNRECNLAGIFLLNCVIFHMQIFTEIHVAMWHVNWFNRIYRLESMRTVKDFVLVMFFKVGPVLLILIVYTIVFANFVHGKVYLLIFTCKILTIRM